MKKQFQGKKVLIMGLGLNPRGSGVTAAKFFCSQGAKVIVTDLKTKKEIAPSLKLLRNLPIHFVLGKHNESDFKSVDLVIKNPGVRRDSKYLQIAKEHNVPIETDISIFFKNCPAKIIGVTGTRGKSTTTSLIYEMLKRKYKDIRKFRHSHKSSLNPGVFMGGNIQFSPLNFLSKVKPKSKVVLELSSWMLEDLDNCGVKIIPHIAVLTNLMPDHLNTYKNFGDYIKAKMLIFSAKGGKNQTKNDFAVLNYDDLNVRKLMDKIKAKKVLFSLFDISQLKEGIHKVFIKDKKIYFDKEEIIAISNIKLFGEHNISNILAAVAVAKLENAPTREIKKVLETFKGLPHRLEFVRKFKGIEFYNDTASTMPEAAIAALKTLGREKNIILIAGGSDKGLDYKKLAKEIRKYCKAVILFEGEASQKILKTIQQYSNITISDSVKTMKDAIKNAVKLAKKGDIILLSPAAASFGLFQNEFDRGEQFKQIVKRLK
jgi:UDP-N-acetylmuramoylalanine--D-glutamate ligase